MQNMKSAFLEFLNKVPFYGSAIVCMDDPNLQSLLPKIKKRMITYGLKTQADYTAREISVTNLKTSFTVFHRGIKLGKVSLESLGNHNVNNTLAAIAVGMELNIEFSAIANALKSFSGVQRRFEILYQSNSLVIIDDYGHHPTEILATLSTAKMVWPNRKLVVVFQPHRYSRTRLLLEDFCSSFNDADKLIVLDVYGAGEKPIEGVDSRQLAKGIKEFGHKDVDYIEDIDSLITQLKFSLQPGDVVLTLGAGNIGKLAHKLVAKFLD